jgi:1-acyl-sn-glycerol-3-phosphate acyltransferase
VKVARGGFTPLFVARASGKSSAFPLRRAVERSAGRTGGGASPDRDERSPRRRSRNWRPRRDARTMARSRGGPAVSDRATYPSPRQRALLTPFFKLLRAYFRARAHGVEHLPAGRPVLLVGKHPQGYLYFETMLIGLFTFFERRELPDIRVMEKQGTSLHKTPLIAWMRENVNAIPATEEAALAALRDGHSVLVFPGGSRELFGPRDQVRWGSHRGFARIAARAGVPVVPFAIAGADRQHPWRLRVGKSNTLWLPLLPLPVRMDFWFGEPIPPPPAEPAERVAAFADEVAAATQALLDRAVAAQRERGVAAATNGSTDRSR